MTLDPSLREALDKVLADFRAGLHTSFPARVLAYDAAAQTLDVRPALRREDPIDAPGEPYEFLPLPDLYNVPVMWPRGGGYAITFPIAVGDWVLVHCAEQSTAPWRLRAQAPSPPGLNDPHGLNGCVALPGWYPDAQKVTGASATDFVIGKDDGTALVRIKPAGVVELGGAPFDALALDTKVRAAIADAIAHHTHAVTVTGTSTEQSGTTAVGALTGTVPSTASSKVKASV